MSWVALGSAALLQLFSGVLRVRAWFHVIRHSCEDASELRYRDVVLAHLGGIGWNAVLPARTGDGIKVALVDRRIPGRHLATVISTLVPPAVVEAGFTILLVAGLIATSLVSMDVLTRTLPQASTVVLVAIVVCMGLIAAFVFRRRLKRLAHDVRAGLAVLSHPRIMGSRILPWLAAGRVVRLLAFALVLTAAGVPFGLAPALALMALQGATPSAGAAATAARIAVLSAVLAGTGAAHVPATHVAEALTAAYGITSVLNLVVSAAVIAWLLRTTSPRRVIGYARSALKRVRRERARPQAQPVPADAPGPRTLAGRQPAMTQAQSLAGEQALGPPAQ